MAVFLYATLMQIFQNTYAHRVNNVIKSKLKNALNNAKDTRFTQVTTEKPTDACQRYLMKLIRYRSQLGMLGSLTGFSMLFAILTTSPAISAIISTEGINENLTVISITGPIEDGDGRKFMLLDISTRNAIVNLNSPGGLVDEGLIIAEQIASSGFDTYVSDTSECLSMCGIVWLSGAQRYLAQNGTVGFHGAYLENEHGSYSVSGPGNARIGAFLGKIELSQTAITFVTNAKPDELSFVGFEDAEILGLEPQSLDEDFLNKRQEVINPIEALKIAANIAYYDTGCLNLFQTPPSDLKQYYNAFVGFAEAILGVQGAGKELDLALINISQSIREEGEIISCIEAEKVIRGANISTGIYGPSFNCAEHVSDVHQTLCRSPNLWAADIVMNSMYWNVRQNRSLIRDTKAFIARQRQWTLMRDGCSTSVSCLEDVYYFRLREISKMISKK